MNDQAPGMTPWNPGPAPSTSSPAPIKEPRQKRKPRAVAAAQPKRETRRTRNKALESAEAAAPARKPRKAKKAKVERAAPDTIKVSMREYAAMRVGEDHAKCFVKLYELLNEGHSKALRTKLLAELQKVFS